MLNPIFSWDCGGASMTFIEYNYVTIDSFLFFQKEDFSVKWVIPFMGMVLYFGSKLTVSMDPQFINLNIIVLTSSTLC